MLTSPLFAPSPSFQEAVSLNAYTVPAVQPPFQTVSVHSGMHFFNTQ